MIKLGNRPLQLWSMTPWFFPLVCWQNLGRWYHLIWRRYHLIWPNCWSYLGGRQANKSRLFRATLGLGRPDCVSLELADADIFTFNLALLIRDRVMKSPLNKQYCKLLKIVTQKVLICVQRSFFTLQSNEKATVKNIKKTKLEVPHDYNSASGAALSPGDDQEMCSRHLNIYHSSFSGIIWYHLISYHKRRFQMMRKSFSRSVTYNEPPL